MYVWHESNVILISWLLLWYFCLVHLERNWEEASITISRVLRILYKLLVGNRVWKREAQNTKICRSERVGHFCLYLSAVKRGWNSYVTVNNWRSVRNHIGVGRICCKITVCFIFAFKSTGLEMKPSLFQILISPLNLKLTRDPEAFTSHEVIGWLQNSLVLHTLRIQLAVIGSVMQSLARCVV